MKILNGSAWEAVVFELPKQILGRGYTRIRLNEASLVNGPSRYFGKERMAHQFFHNSFGAYAVAEQDQLSAHVAPVGVVKSRHFNCGTNTKSSQTRKFMGFWLRIF